MSPLASPSRGSLIALGAASVVAITARADIGPADPGATPGQHAWDEAMMRYQTAQRTYGEYETSVWDRIRRQVEAECPRPRLQFEIVARNGYKATYRLRPDRLYERDDHSSIRFREAAFQERQRWLAHVECRRRLKADKADVEIDRLGAIAYETRWALIYMRAPNHAALLWKAEQLLGEHAADNDDGSCPAWAAKVMSAFMTDAQRLLSSTSQNREKGNRVC